MCAKRIEPWQRRKIVEALRRKNRTYQQLSQEFQCSVSSIHRISEAEGLANRRQRTSAVERPEHTYDKEKRVGVLDRILKSVEDTVSKGGLSSKQLLDISRAAKEVSAARQNEDRIDPEPIQDQKPNERGYLDVGLGDMKIHKDDPLLEDFKRIEAKGLVGRSQDPPEAEFNGEGASPA